MRGGLTTLRIEGRDLTDCRLFISGTGITLSHPTTLPGSTGVTSILKCSAGAEIGFHDIVAVTSHGASFPTTSIWVGVFPQRSEVEPNDDNTHAEPITPAVPTVYGRIDRVGDRDCFSFRGQAGEDWIVDCVKGGSDFNPILDVQDENGGQVAHVSADREQNRRAVVRLPRTGQYSITVTDAANNGRPEYYYILTVGKLPVVQDFKPHAERPGRTVGLIIRGVNLGGTTRARISVPRDTERYVTASVRTTAGPSLPFHFPIAEQPAIEVTESDQTMAVPQIPSDLEGKFEVYPVARFYFDADVGDHLYFNLVPRYADFKYVQDAEIRILDSEGKVVEARGILGMALVSPDHKDRYIFEIRSRGGAVGPDKRYCLEIRRILPGFSVSLQLNGLDVWRDVKAGESIQLRVEVSRRGGFAGDVEVVADGLPRGVKLSRGSIPAGSIKRELTLSVDRNASHEPFLLRLKGKARIDRELVEHGAYLSGGVNSAILVTSDGAPLPVIVSPFPTGAPPAAK